MNSLKEWAAFRSLHVMRNRARGKKDTLEQQVTVLGNSLNIVTTQRDDAIKRLARAYDEIGTLREKLK